jgi:hypothetical protein
VNYANTQEGFFIHQKRMWLVCEPGAGSGEQGAGKKRAGSRDCRKKSRNR